MGDSRIGKCCCGGCDWPVITSTSDHTLSHCDTAKIQYYGAICTLTTPNGTLPGNLTASVAVQQTSANHWHATHRTALIDIAAGDYSWGVASYDAAAQPPIFTPNQNVWKLYSEVTCDEAHDIWTGLGLDTAYYDVGIPSDSRLFWLSATKNSNSKVALIFFNTTYDSSLYGGYHRHRWYLTDTLGDTIESAIGETDSIAQTVIVDNGVSFVVYVVTWSEYFQLIKNIQ